MQHERTSHERCLLRWHRRDCSPCNDFRRQSNCLKVSSRNLSIGSSVSADSVDRAAAEALPRQTRHGDGPRTVGSHQGLQLRSSPARLSR